MISGYIPEDSIETSPEAIKAKAEKELTPEQRAALEANAEKWNMNGIPEFGATPVEATAVGFAAAETIDAATSIAREPNEADNIGNPDNPDNIDNVDNIDNRSRATATEKAADNLIDNNNLRNSSENIISAVGSTETVMSDADQAASNINQAKTAAEGIAGKVASGESSGKTEAENILNAAMVAGADANATAKKATVETINGDLSADSTATEAKEAIVETQDLVNTLQEASMQVQDPELTAKMQTAAESISSDLTKQSETLEKATAVAAAAEEEDEPSSFDTLMGVDGETKDEADEYPHEAPKDITIEDVTDASEDELAELAKARAKREAEAATDETLTGTQIDRAA